MPTRLKNLKIKRVALVDEGANPDADIEFMKRREPPQQQQPPAGGSTNSLTAEEEQTLSQRFFSALAKALGKETDVRKKDPKTFGQLKEKCDYDKVLDTEIWPMLTALRDSAVSILYDSESDSGAKEALLKQSASEFATAFTEACGNWSKGQGSGTVSKSMEDALESMTAARDSLNAAIAKATGKPAGGAVGGGDDDTDPDDPDDKPGPDDPDDPDKDDDDGKGVNPTVKKGATNMIFDTDKMTEEERATFEDLAKRYSREEATPSPTPAQQETPAGTATADDVWKGINPAIREELEALRKFRQDAEEKEIADVAKRYEILGKKPEELTPLLKSLKAAGGTAYDDMISMLDSAKAQVESSGLFTEIGKRGTTPDSGENAWAKVEAAAQEIQKARPSLSRAEAIDAACMEHPELVADYEQSRR